MAKISLNDVLDNKNISQSNNNQQVNNKNTSNSFSLSDILNEPKKVVQPKTDVAPQPALTIQPEAIKEPTKAYFEDTFNNVISKGKSEQTKYYESLQNTDNKDLTFSQKYDKYVMSKFNRVAGNINTTLLPTIASMPKAIDDLIDLVKGQDLSTGNGNWADRLNKTGQLYGESQKAMAGITAENETFGDKVFQATGSMFSFLIPSTAVGKGAGLVVKGSSYLSKVLPIAEKVAKFAPAISVITAQGVMTTLEASMEMSNAYESALSNGKTEEQANDNAKNVFIANAILIGSTNKFSKYFETMDSGIKAVVKRVITAYLSEGSQEAGQQIIGNLASGVDWTDGVLESGAIGGIIGSGASLATANIYKENGEIDLKKVEEVVKNTQEVNVYIKNRIGQGEEKEEIVKDIAENKDIDLETAQNMVDSAIQSRNIADYENDSNILDIQPDTMYNDDGTSKLDSKLTTKTEEKRVEYTDNIAGLLKNGNSATDIKDYLQNYYNINPKSADSLITEAQLKMSMPQESPAEPIATAEKDIKVEEAKTETKIDTKIKNPIEINGEILDRDNEMPSEDYSNKLTKEIRRLEDEITRYQIRNYREEILNSKKYNKEEKLVLLNNIDSRLGNFNYKPKDINTYSKLKEEVKNEKKDVIIKEKKKYANKSTKTNSKVKNIERRVNEAVSNNEDNKVKEESVKEIAKVEQELKDDAITEARDTFSEDLTTEELVSKTDEFIDSYKDYNVKKEIKLANSENKFEVDSFGNVFIDGNFIGANLSFEDFYSKLEDDLEFDMTDLYPEDSATYRMLSDEQYDDLIDEAKSDFQNDYENAFEVARNEGDKILLDNFNKVFGVENTIDNLQDTEYNKQYENTDIQSDESGTNNNGESISEDVSTNESKKKRLSRKNKQNSSENAEREQNGKGDNGGSGSTDTESGNRPTTQLDLSNFTKKKYSTSDNLFLEYASKYITTQNVIEDNLPSYFESKGLQMKDYTLLDIDKVESRDGKNIYEISFKINNLESKSIKEVLNDSTTITEDGLVVVNNSISQEAIDRIKEEAENYITGGESKSGRGVIDEYYTDLRLTDSVKNFLNINDNANILEPSVGLGNFIPNLDGKNTDGFEINEDTARMSAVLFPESRIYNKSFETLFVDEKGNPVNTTNRYDLIIGNPPYSERNSKYKGLGELADINRFEDYFIYRGADLLANGGVMALVVPQSVLNGKTFDKTAKHLIEKGVYVEKAFRLPNGIFKGTDIGTDLIFYRQDFEKADELKDRLINGNYFTQNPENILGEVVQKKNRFGKMEDYIKGSLEENVLPVLENQNNIFVNNATENQTREEYEVEKKQDEEINKRDKKTAEKIIKKVGKKVKIEPVKSKGGVRKITSIAESLPENERKMWLNTNIDGSVDTSKVDIDESIMMYEDGKWYPDFNYLQGDIYQKLENLGSQQSKISKEQYARQEKALLNVLPEKKTADKLFIDPTHFLLKEIKVPNTNTMTGAEKEITIVDDFVNTLWKLDREAFGDVSRNDIFDYVRGIRVSGSNKDRNQVIRDKRPIIARDLFNRYFREVIDEDKRSLIVDNFNRTFNANHIPDYSKVPLFADINTIFNGKTLKIRSQQLDGIGMLVNKKKGLLEHDVGFGKTLSSIIATHELMYRGLKKKPLFVVPKSTYSQWIDTIKQVIPNASINSLESLSNLKNDVKTQEAKDIINSFIKEGEWNVINYDGFKKLEFNRETYDEYGKRFNFIQTDFDKILSGESERSKQLRSQKEETRKGQLEKGTTNFNFEDMGIDHLVFDEIHKANNGITTIATSKGKEKAKSGKNAGKEVNKYEHTEFSAVNTPAKPSNVAIKAWLASQYIQDKYNGTGIIGLSATPFTNSPVQQFFIASIFNHSLLVKMGVDNVNDFINTFIKTRNVINWKSDSSFKEETIVDGVKNLQLFNQLFDTFRNKKEPRDAPEFAKLIPTKHIRQYSLPPTEEILNVFNELQEEYKADKSGMKLKISGEMKMLGVSKYLLGKYKDGLNMANYKKIVEESPRILSAVNAVKENINSNDDNAQIIYLDKGTGLIPMIKKYLENDLGLGEGSVGDITGDTSLKKRDTIKESFNEKGNKMRVLIGSSAISTGMNLQERTTDIHFLDYPYNLTDYIQIEGRGWRFGNKFKNIHMNHYLMENSYDVLLFQILQAKQERYNALKKEKLDESNDEEISTQEIINNLITDPELKASLKIMKETGDYKVRLQHSNGELSFFNIKNNKLVEVNKNIDNVKSSIEWSNEKIGRYKDNLTDDFYKDRPEDLARYEKYIIEEEANIKEYEKNLAKFEKEKEKTLADYEAKGIDVNRVKQLETEIEDLEKKIKQIDNKEYKDTLVAEYSQDRAGNTFFTKKDIDNLVKEVKENNADENRFAVFGSEPIVEVEENQNVVADEVQEENQIEQTKEDNVVKKTSTKKTSTKKRVAKVKTGTEVASKDLQIINDKEMSVKDKITTLLDIKQQGKEVKDVGTRVSGSKKEKAVIKLIYKYGNQELNNELINVLGAESYLEVVNKEQVLEDIGYTKEKFINDSIEKKATYGEIKAKIDYIDGIFNKPSFMRKKKYSRSTNLHYRKDGEATRWGDSVYLDNAEGVKIATEFSKIYPNLLKNFVNIVINAKTSSDLLRGSFGVDKDGNILSGDDFGKSVYIVEQDMFSRQDMNSYNGLGYYMNESRIESSNKYYEENEGSREIDYESLKNKYLVSKPKESVNLEHGNFATIDKYDIGDNEVPKEKVKAENLTKDYGFASAQFGNYMDDSSSYEHIQQTMGAVDSMSKILGLDLPALIKAKGLSIAYGARGGGRYLAHYEPTKNIINITKKRGDGSFGHEFGHFLDYVLGSRRGKISDAYKGDRYYQDESEKSNLMKEILGRGVLRNTTYDMSYLTEDKKKRYDEDLKELPPEDEKVIIKYLTDENNNESIGEAINNSGYIGVVDGSIREGNAYNFRINPDIVSYLRNKPFTFKKKSWGNKFIADAKKIGGGKEKSYWNSEVELFARAFQTYLEDKGLEMGIVNNYMTHPTKSENLEEVSAYPQGEDRIAINKAFDNLFKKESKTYKTEESKEKEAEYNAKTEPMLAKIKEKEAEKYQLYLKYNEYENQIRDEFRARPEIANLLEKIDGLKGTDGINRNQERNELKQEYADLYGALIHFSSAIIDKVNEYKREIGYFAMEEEIRKMRDDVLKVAEDFGMDTYRYKTSGDFIYEKPATEEFLNDIKSRLKIDFDVVWVDRIMTQSGYDKIEGVSVAGSTILLRKDTSWTTPHHEALHITLANIDKISSLKGFNKEELLNQFEGATEIAKEEKMAMAFEEYVKDETKNQKGSVGKFFEWLLIQIKSLAKSMSIYKGDMVKDYFDTMLYEKSIFTRMTKLQNENAREYYNYIDGEVILINTFNSRLKESLSGIIADINSNKAIMSQISKITDKYGMGVNEVIDKAKQDVEKYVESVIAVQEVVKNGNFNDGFYKYLESKGQKEVLETKIQSVQTQIKKIKRNIKNVEESTKTLEKVVMVENEIILDSSIEDKKIVSDSSVGESKIAKRFNEGNFVDGMEFSTDYDRKTFIKESAKAKAFLSSNSKDIEKYIKGELLIPDEADINPIIFANEVVKYVEKNNPKLLKDAMNMLKDISIESGQNSAFTNSIYKSFEDTNSMLYYANEIQKLKNSKIVNLAKKNNFIKKVNTIYETKIIEKIKKQVIEKKSKEGKYKDLKENLNTKIQDLDNFLKELKC